MRRRRITITVKEEVLHEVDKLVNDMTIRSRSQAIEFLLTKTVEKYKIGGALILAGGRDKLDGRPKCMALVNGKPVLEHVIIHLGAAGVDNIVIYVDWEGDKITGYFKDGKALGVKIRYMVGERPQGRAIPIKMAHDYFDDTFLVYYGDTLCSIDIKDMIRSHKDNASLVTMALTTVSNPGSYGVVKMKGNRITDFEEKPEKIGSHMVSAGIFLIEPSVLRSITNDMASPENDLFPKLAKKNQLFGYLFEGLWLNINDASALRKANNLWG